MTSINRVMFRIPDNYTDFLLVVEEERGMIVDADVPRADYDEFFAFHVDDVIEVTFNTSDTSGWESLSRFMRAAEKHRLAYAAISSADPRSDGMIAFTGRGYCSHPGLNAEDALIFTLRETFSPEDSVGTVFDREDARAPLMITTAGILHNAAAQMALPSTIFGNTDENAFRMPGT